MLRIFLTAFGLTQPKPQEENKAALFLFGTLAILALLLATTIWFILNLSR